MSSLPPKRVMKLHANWAKRHQSLLSALRGFRNGIMAGARIRMPYVIQAIAYALIYYETKG